MNKQEVGAALAADFLEHYGVKGMKWGVRRKNRVPKTPLDVTVKTKPGRRVKTKGGGYHSPHEDAISAARSRQIAKRSTTDALSNKELQHLLQRMQLEDNYQRIMSNEKRQGVGKTVAKNLLREFDSDLTTELAVGVAGSMGKQLTKQQQSQIRLGTAITRAAFGVKSGQVKKEEKKINEDDEDDKK